MNRPKILTRAALADFPLPSLDGVEDKDARGCLLAIAGSLRVPGAALLAGMAAFRAGAGKVQIAVPRSIAAIVGIAVPEAGLVLLEETTAGDGLWTNDPHFAAALKKSGAVLIGPGLMDEAGAAAFTLACLKAHPRVAYVLDALALSADLRTCPEVKAAGKTIVLTPHHGEMATLLGIDKTKVAQHPLKYATQVAAALRCVVALKADITYIVSGSGDAWVHEGGVVGLATSGSGDVLAGILAGLLARGAEPLTAALWAVLTHGDAGRSLTGRVAPVGFLARELMDVIPGLLTEAASG